MTNAAKIVSDAKARVHDRVSSLPRRCEVATRKMSADDFIRQWWAKRFPNAKPPMWDSAITCADAADLLNKYYKYLESMP